MYKFFTIKFIRMEGECHDSDFSDKSISYFLPKLYKKLKVREKKVQRILQILWWNKNVFQLKHGYDLQIIY